MNTLREYVRWNGDPETDPGYDVDSTLSQIASDLRSDKDTVWEALNDVFADHGYTGLIEPIIARDWLVVGRWIDKHLAEALQARAEAEFQRRCEDAAR